jgi:uncharacterized protein (DUF2147 family)
MPRSILSAAAAAVIILACAPALAQPAAPQGVWRTASGNLDVEIAPCGPVLCGTAVKVLANHSMAAGQAQQAPPPKVGLKLITELKPAKAGVWRGRLYNRENGKTYDCLITPQGTDAIKLHAYVGLPLFGKDQVWRRTR